MTSPEPRELSLTATDDGAGSRLQALVYQPTGTRPGGAPLVVCCHGLGENALRMAPVAMRLAQAGAFAVCPSFRGGGGGQPGSTTAMSAMTQVSDVELILQAVRQVRGVDPGRTALLGRSLGGLVAALTAARHPTEVTALALWYPALRSPDGLRSRFGSPDRVPQTFTIPLEEGQITLGRRYATDVWQIDVEAQLRRYRSPVLLVHGDKDRSVPLGVSQRAVTVLPDARLVRLDGAGHGFAGQDFEYAVHQTLSFLSWAEVLED